MCARDKVFDGLIGNPNHGSSKTGSRGAVALESASEGDERRVNDD